MLPNPLAVNTWIRYKNIRSDSLYHDYRKGDTILFMGWISNPEGGDNALIMDDRGIRTLDLAEDEWEAVKDEQT